jgi:hypothetical protein
MKGFGPGTLPVTFAASRPLRHDIEIVAAVEGISRADVVRRAVLLDMRRRKEEQTQPSRGRRA